MEFLFSSSSRLLLGRIGIQVSKEGVQKGLFLSKILLQGTLSKVRYLFALVLGMRVFCSIQGGIVVQGCGRGSLLLIS